MLGAIWLELLRLSVRELSSGGVIIICGLEILGLSSSGGVMIIDGVETKLGRVPVFVCGTVLLGWVPPVSILVLGDNKSWTIFSTDENREESGSLGCEISDR
jgi:hypothetical protein